MPTEPDYPFEPKLNKHLRPGQFWAILLADGRFAAGRVMAVPAFGASFLPASFASSDIDFVIGPAVLKTPRRPTANEAAVDIQLVGLIRGNINGRTFRQLSEREFFSE